METIRMGGPIRLHQARRRTRFPQRQFRARVLPLGSHAGGAGDGLLSRTRATALGRRSPDAEKLKEIMRRYGLVPVPTG